MGLEQVEFPGASQRLGTAAHAEFAVDIAEVLFHCASGDGEVSGSLLVGKASSHKAQDFTLTWTQRLQKQRKARPFLNSRWSHRIWKLCQQSAYIFWHHLPGPCLLQECGHCWSLIEEEASVAMCLSELEGLGELEEGLLCLTKSLIGSMPFLL